MLLKKPTRSFRYLIFPAILGASLALFSACKVDLNPTAHVDFLEEEVEIVEKPVQNLLVSMKVDGVEEVFEVRIEEDFISPIENARILSKYGMREHPIKKGQHLHHGVDYRAAMGTPIRASASGKITKANISPKGYGKHIEIQHSDGMSTIYAQLSELKVSLGQEVKQGEIIALSGNSGQSTGPHLHFEIRKNGKSVDPEKYLKK